MGKLLPSLYRKALWDVYARAIAMVSIVGLVAAAILGGYDLLKWAFPAFTLNAALHEKYQNNESFTKFGVLHKGLPEQEITRQRQSNYRQLLRMERRNARQSLIRIGLGLLMIGFLNALLVVTYRQNP